MKWSLGLLIVIFFSLHTQARTCVLSMFEAESQEEKIVRGVFGFDKNSVVIYRPSLAQIESCFQGSYEEIIWASHGAVSPLSGKAFPVFIGSQGEKLPLLSRFVDRLSKDSERSNLKRFRVAVCGVGRGSASIMDGLLAKLKSSGVDVDVPPRFDFGSKVVGEDVTRLTTVWLARNLDRKQSEIWRTNGNAYCKADYWPNCDRDSAEWVVPLSR